MQEGPNPLSPFERLVEIMALLRSEGGCAWDRKQDMQTLKRFLLEEAYEVLEAVEEEDPGHVCEELGDLLMLIVFYARVAEEQGLFDVSAVCRGICEKLVRRHPHVFASAGDLEAEEVLKQWEQIKLQERGEARRPSLLDGIPRSLPALARAQKVVGRASEAGFAWPDLESALAKVREELAEVEEAVAAGETGPLQDELGDLLLAAVGLARVAGIDAEMALRRSTGRFVGRFHRLEERLEGDLSGSTPEELLRTWREVAPGPDPDS